ncbi:hypothetical protein Srot_0237 [Segniliparus rotundus DSM 44985]|uniref:Uncharacterized protein n=1 Tax=Segniliparus rotundus (strain ATCC BAA-972 / CDC 1076 / CIP 108378 / DSM 44985 / JCM 13578) TaxID=640132 RepID=D6ZAI2_SEGRD|nr:hypothetical protein [Segniliparus rotundus]ADG96724.1 hypothetical protein Srot_0237 [Segniliparus rotundus DSM 44985]
MGPVRARRFFSTLAIAPDAVRVVNAVAYGAALGFRLAYVKSMVANPSKARTAAMRRAGAVTAAVEGGLYDAAHARLGDSFLAAQETYRRKRSILGDLLASEPAPKRTALLSRALSGSRAVPGLRRLLPKPQPAQERRNRAKLVTPRCARALRSSVLGPSPTMLSADGEPHDYRTLWTPKDRRVEHQLLIALEEFSGLALPGLTKGNLLPFTDPETGLLVPWDEAVASSGAIVVDRAVLEYLLDSRYGDGILRGAEAFNSARAL